MQKGIRQSAIIKLISAAQIGTQEELSELLEKKGFSVTQSSVSRDLDELGIIKVNGFYSLPMKPRNAFINGLLSMEQTGDNLIVAKCEPGLASAIAVRIDAAGIQDIAGTIAGDDTIFIAVIDAKTQKNVIKNIWELFEN